MNTINLKYLIPNSFTALSLILGLSALHLINLGNFYLAAWLIGFAMVCDFLDGKFARMLNAQSKFGAQFDTLSDFVTFGVAPGFLAYSSLLNELSYVGAAVSIFYVFCGGYRLVRFTLKNKTTSKKDNLKYLVPNSFTALSLILGLSALHLINLGNFYLAAWLIGFAMVCDFLDGKFARILNAQSKFGAQFDTLSDFVTFGVAPGFLAYSSLLNELSYVGAAVSIFYVFCGGYRLVRFTLKNKTTSKKQPFIGLPIPAAAGMIASFIIFNSYFNDSKIIIDLLIISTFLVSILMISKIEYLPLEKGKKLSKESKFFIFLAIISVILAIEFSYFIFIIWMLIYIIYGVVRQILLTINSRTSNINK